MLPQRVAQQSLRRLVGSGQQGALRFAAPAAIATGSFAQYQRRLVAAKTITPEDATNGILAKQRLLRPVAPHLSIYQPQITWYLSMLNRLTGIALSGPFYLFGVAYLVAPAIGIHLESAVIAASFATWPVAVKVLLKAVLSWPLTFHTFNGIRHLVWDTGRLMKNTQVNKSGWITVGASVVCSLALGFVGGGGA